MTYPIVKNKPVAKFWYKGNHSHPVKRTLLITNVNNSTITGYELREGFDIRKLNNSPIKSFRKDKIASFNELRKESRKNRKDSTLIRYELSEIMENGF